MILLDANLLIYGYVREQPQHRSARQWLDEVLNGPHRVGLPWPSLLAFVRIVSNPRLFQRPSSISAAWKQVEEWLALPVAWIPVPGSAHAAVLGDLLTYLEGKPEHVPDAHLAALAVEHGLTLCTTDRDFARFPQLRWKNPLTP